MWSSGRLAIASLAKSTRMSTSSIWLRAWMRSEVPWRLVVEATTFSVPWFSWSRYYKHDNTLTLMMDISLMKNQTTTKKLLTCSTSVLGFNPAGTTHPANQGLHCHGNSIFHAQGYHARCRPTFSIRRRALQSKFPIQLLLLFLIQWIFSTGDW